MTYETYILIVCTIVYALLAGLSIFVIILFTKMTLRLIRHGVEDDRIKKEYKKMQGKRKCGAVDCIVSVFCALLFTCAFAFSVYVNVQEDKYFDNIPTLKVVKSGSMSKKLETNTYLFENNLNDQFQNFDIIFTYALPKEEDLQLYDIVVYEVDGGLLVHRIVGIEEPNAEHPDERYFLLQGDAVERPDRFPVHYSQMRAIYRGKHIANVGSFVTFLQSPAGWMCMILIVIAIVATPIIEKIIEKAKKARLANLGGAVKFKPVNNLAVGQVNSVQNAPNVLPPKWGAPVYVYPVYPVYQNPNENKPGGKQ